VPLQARPYVREEATWDDYTDVNRANWDARTAINAASAHYDVAGFKSGS
jgi:hypothetical protein